MGGGGERLGIIVEASKTSQIIGMYHLESREKVGKVFYRIGLQAWGGVGG